MSTSTSTLRTRVVSLLTLCGLALGVAYGGRGAYRLCTDSFVAPIVLSPDSDIVITSSLRLSELEAERAKMVAERERIDAEMEASTTAIERLAELAKVAEGSLAWATVVSREASLAGQRDLAELRAREQSLRAMQAKQAAFVEETERNLAAGLIARADYFREEQALSQLRLAAVDTERARLATSLQLKQAELAQTALAGEKGRASMLTPEMIAQRSQSVHVELELLKLAAERRSLKAKREVAEGEIAKIDVLMAQMRARPVFRAVNEHLDVAFVPYTQLEGVERGAVVYDCLWGVFSCTSVGAVSELLPGEVIMPDPWGAQARGQYAVLALEDRDASREKVLRIRAGEASSTPPLLSAKQP